MEIQQKDFEDHTETYYRVDLIAWRLKLGRFDDRSDRWDDGPELGQRD